MQREDPLSQETRNHDMILIKHNSLGKSFGRHNHVVMIKGRYKHKIML